MFDPRHSKSCPSLEHHRCILIKQPGWGIVYGEYTSTIRALVMITFLILHSWPLDAECRALNSKSGCWAQCCCDCSGPVNNSTCTVDWSIGTSTSAPLVAGGAALVRQYFTDGFYPTGSKVAGNVFLPSAPLLKAIIFGALTIYWILSSALIYYWLS